MVYLYFAPVNTALYLQLYLLYLQPLISKYLYFVNRGLPLGRFRTPQTSQARLVRGSRDGGKEIAARPAMPPLLTPAGEQLHDKDWRALHTNQLVCDEMFGEGLTRGTVPLASGVGHNVLIERTVESTVFTAVLYLQLYLLYLQLLILKYA